MLFEGRKYQRVAEILQRVQREIEEEGGDSDTGHRIEEGLAEASRRVGVDLEVARIADLPTLERTLAAGGRPDPAKCWAVAEALFLDGLRARRRGEDARALLEKARGLYGHVSEGLDLPQGAPAPGARIRRIEELLGS